jgi:hypothetical protein
LGSIKSNFLRAEKQLPTPISGRTLISFLKWALGGSINISVAAPTFSEIAIVMY